MNPTDLVDRDSLRDDIPAFRPGDTLKVHVRVVEGTRQRVQVFQGIVIRRQGSGLQETFTVRKISFGVGVERTFPVHTPTIAKIEVESHGDVRRAKLYHVRRKAAKEISREMRRVKNMNTEISETGPVAPEVKAEVESSEAPAAVAA